MRNNDNMSPSFGLSIGDLIRVYRKKSRITQKDLAKILKLSPSTIVNYESGKTIPDIYTLMQICTILEIPKDIILREVNELVLDMYNADEGIIIDSCGKVCGPIKQIKATVFNFYKCRKCDYCCILKNGTVYLMKNVTFLECEDTGLVKFYDDDVFVLAKFDGKQYTDISTGKESKKVEAIVARSLGEVEDYEIIE